MTHHICPFQRLHSITTRSKFWRRLSAETASEATPCSTPALPCPPTSFSVLRCPPMSFSVLRCRSKLIRNTSRRRIPRRVFLLSPLQSKFNFNRFIGQLRIIPWIQIPEFLVYRNNILLLKETYFVSRETISSMKVICCFRSFILKMS